MQALRLETRTSDRAGIGTRDRNGIIRLLAGRRRDMILNLRHAVKALLRDRGRRLLHPHHRRRGLQRRETPRQLVTGLGLHVGESEFVPAGIFLVLVGEVGGDAALFGGVDVVGVGVVVVERGAEGGGHGGFGEAGRVGGGLGAQLGEVEVGAGFVADVHALVQFALGVEAVEDDGVDGDCYYFDDDFDDGADEGPVLKWRRLVGGLGKKGGGMGSLGDGR